MSGAMASSLALFLLYFCCLLRPITAKYTYSLVDDYSGQSFFSGFDFFTGHDPTNGFVKYLSQSEAKSSGLIGNYASNDKKDAARMGVDSKNVAKNGRPSVRIASKKIYNEALVIADFAHVPSSTCGSWPAFWMLGPKWPDAGEIDIYENVHDAKSNTMTLHTSSGCKVEKDADQLGQAVTSNCDVNASGQSTNQGCQVKSQNSNSFGSALNSAGGGIFATEWSKDIGIKIWHFNRKDSRVAGILANKPDPSSWGTPDANFRGGSCDFTKSFVDLQIIFDTTFCGEWAGSVWSQSSCAKRASKCDDFVANNPNEFKDSYWGVNYVKVFQK